MKIENKTVVMAVPSQTEVTLYFDDGTTMVLPSDSHFTHEVIEKIKPALEKGEKITLNMESKTIDIFSEFEKKTNGLVKFFRVAKKALLGLGDEPTMEKVASIQLPLNAFNLDNEQETIVAVVENPEANEIAQEDLEAAAELHDSLVQETKPSEPEEEPAQPEAIPVMDAVPAPKPAPQKKTHTVIPGAENLKNQVAYFGGDVDHKGFMLFMQRLAKVQEARQHSAQELLDFMRKGDLPIADDGCIVAYKRLKRKQGPILVDSHTGKVTQRVGSRVFMKPEMVDPNRRNECSNGLHIGRRDYMGSFSGDVIIICKIHPEDVIAVPQDYSGSKMRCAGYDIVAELSVSAYQSVIKGQKMTDGGDNEASIMLTKILRGDHPKVDQLVEITGQNGNGLKITELGNKHKVTEPVEEVPVQPTKALDDVEAIVAKADPKKISPKALKESAKKAPAKVEMTAEQKLAKKEWPNVLNGTITKVALAKKCKTSSRSLERWAKKFNF